MTPPPKPKLSDFGFEPTKPKLDDFGFQPTGEAADSQQVADFGFKPTPAPSGGMRAYMPPEEMLTTAAPTPRPPDIYDRLLADGAPGSAQDVQNKLLAEGGRLPPPISYADPPDRPADLSYAEVKKFVDAQQGLPPTPESPVPVSELYEAVGMEVPGKIDRYVTSLGDAARGLVRLPLHGRQAMERFRPLPGSERTPLPGAEPTKKVPTARSEAIDLLLNQDAMTPESANAAEAIARLSGQAATVVGGFGASPAGLTANVGSRVGAAALAAGGKAGRIAGGVLGGFGAIGGAEALGQLATGQIDVATAAKETGLSAAVIPGALATLRELAASVTSEGDFKTKVDALAEPVVSTLFYGLVGKGGYKASQRPAAEAKPGWKRPKLLREEGVPTRAQEIRGYPRPVSQPGDVVEGGKAPSGEGVQRRAEAKPEAGVREVQEVPKAAEVEKPVLATPEQIVRHGDPKFPKPPVDELAESHPEPKARKSAFDIVKQTTRRYAGMMHQVNANVRKWTATLEEPQREDVGAMIEGIGNLRVKGDTAEKVRVRATPEMRELAKKYRDEQERGRQEVNKLVQMAEGTPEFLKYVTDYLPHFYVGSRKKLAETYTKWRKQTPHAKRRIFPTYQEAVEAGFKPISQDFAYLYQRAAENNVKAAVTRRAMAKLRALSALAEEQGQTPLMSPNLDKAGQGYVKIDHPVLRRVYARRTKDGKLILGEGSVWVHPDLVRPIKVLLDKPLRGPVWGAIRAVNSLGKSINVAFSVFHEITLYESAQSVLARPWNPVRGIFIGPFESKRLGLEFTPRLTYRAGLLLDVKDPLGTKEGIESGLGMNRSAAADYARTYLQKGLREVETLASEVPGLNYATRQTRRGYDWYQRHLWDNTHVGLKLFSYHTLAREMLPNLPVGITERHAREVIASHLNDAFGGQEYLEVPTLRKGHGAAWEPMTIKEQQIAHALVFAPDWTWSNIRVAGRTLTNFKDPIARKLGLRYWRNMTMTLASSATLIQRTIHALWGQDDPDHKKYPWQNEPKRKWDIDVTPMERSVRRILGLKVSKERHYIHMGKQAREVLRYFSDFPRGLLQNLGNKSSVGVRLLAEQFTGYRLGSSFPMPWMDAGFRDGLRGWEELKARAKAVGEHFIPFSYSPTNFAFAVPRRKGMTPYRAMRGFKQALELHVDPSTWQRIKLADPSKRSKAVQQLFADIRTAAKANGIKPDHTKRLFQSARSKVRSKYYGLYFDAWEDNDQKDVDKYGAILEKLGAGKREVQAAGKRRAARAR